MEEIYKNYTIYAEDFKSFGIDSLISKFEIFNREQRFLVVFALGSIELSKCRKTQEELLEKCMDIVKELVNSGVKENQYYEYQVCEFLKVDDPKWWKK